MSKFLEFLHNLEQMNFETNTTANGVATIQQTPRNQIRKDGVAAFLEDVKAWYGCDFDICETKEGIVVVVENEPTDQTVSLEFKLTIKSLDYDPFEEANQYDEDRAAKAQKKAQREADKVARAEALETKRNAKLEELARKREITG